MWMDVDKWGKQKRKDAFIPSVRLSLRISHFSEEPELVILSHIFTKKSSAGYLELLRPTYFSSFFGFSTLSTHRPVPVRWKRPARAHQECMRKRKKLCRDYPRFCAGYQHGKLSQKNSPGRNTFFRGTEHRQIRCSAIESLQAVFRWETSICYKMAFPGNSAWKCSFYGRKLIEEAAFSRSSATYMPPPADC